MDRDKLIQKLIAEKGGSKEDYLSLMDKIAYHESAHTMNPSIKQIGGGPGRGKYQFEEGRNQGGITAARRTKRYLDSINESTPKWLNEALQGNSLDATQLNSDQQDILFLGNMRMHPKADLANVVNGKESVADFWANYHWAGDSKDRDTRIESFNKSISKLSPEQTQAPKQDPLVNTQREQAFPQIDNTAVAMPNMSHAEMYTGPSPNNIPTEQELSSGEDLFSFLNSRNQEQPFNEINTGESHENNSNGGVPHGTGANGQQNTVEEGETSFNFGDDKFIFSDRISLTDYVNKGNSKSNQYALGGTIDPPDDEVKDYYDKYMSSAGYKNKLISSGYSFPNSITNERLNNIKNTKVSYQDKQPGFFEQIKNMVTDTPYTTVGSVYKPTDNQVIMDNEQTNSISKNHPESAKKEVLAHELNHAALDRKTNGVYGTNLNEYDAKQLYDRLQGKQGRNKHEINPEERHSDLNAFRFYLHDQGLFDPTSNKKFTKKDLDKALEYSPGSYNFSRLLRDYKEDDLIWLMNNVASTDQKNKNKNIV